MIRGYCLTFCIRKQILAKQAYSHNGMTIQITAALDCLRPLHAGAVGRDYEILIFSCAVLLTTALRGAKRSAVQYSNLIKSLPEVPSSDFASILSGPDIVRDYGKFSCSWNFKIWRRKILPNLYTAITIMAKRHRENHKDRITYAYHCYSDNWLHRISNVTRTHEWRHIILQWQGISSFHIGRLGDATSRSSASFWGSTGYGYGQNTHVRVVDFQNKSHPPFSANGRAARSETKRWRGYYEVPYSAVMVSLHSSRLQPTIVLWTIV